jgi:hypothetical protein
MRDIDRRRYDVLGRIRDFGATYGDLFPESSLASQAFAVVSNAVEEIQGNDVSATAAQVGARSTRTQTARRALRERLLLMARTAAVLPDVEAGFREHFTLPAKTSDQALLTIARQSVQRATPMAATFVAHGMTPAFLRELTALIDGFEGALRARGGSRGEVVAARAAIREALTAAFKAIRQLDVIVANHLTSNPVALEVWHQAKRIVYPPAARKTAEAAPPAMP